MSSEQRAGEPTVLTAKPGSLWPSSLFLFQFWLLLAHAVAIGGGLVPPEPLTVVLFLCGTVLLFLLPVLGRLFVLDVLSYDDDGVVLRPSRKGFLAQKAFSFRWDEVAAAYRGEPPSSHELKVRLTRVRRFWNLPFQLAVKLKIPPALWRDERFREALRRHVSAEKLAAGVLNEGGATRRRALLAGGILLACAAAVALCCTWFLAVPGFSLPILVWLLPVSVLVGCCVWRVGFDGPAGAAMVVGGAFFAALFLLYLFLDLSLWAVTGMGTVAGAESALAGLLLGAAVLTFLGRRTRWSHVGLFYLLGLAGWGVGVIAWDGIPSVRLGEVTTSTAQWTVTGDGLVLEQSAAEGVMLKWFSADGKPERAVAVPVPEGMSCTVLLGGAEAAIYEVAGEGPTEGFVVPRYGGEPRVIAMNARWLDVRLSPDGRRCVFLTRAESGASWAVSYLELPDGELQQASFPAGQEHAESIGILNDGRLLLVTGERPEDLEGRGMWHWSELPQGDTWKPTCEPVKVWVWDPRGGEAPRLLHAEEQMSLDWRLPTASSPLYICRVVGDGTRHKEFVEVRLESDPLEVRPCPPGRFDWLWAYQASADGRFVVETSGDDSLWQVYVRDTLTGRRRRLRDRLKPWVLWSPQGHKFLYTTVEAPLTMPWESRVANTFRAEEPPLVAVARLVDLDR